jgi:nucleoside-diphosphate-sugar epimerase
MEVCAAVISEDLGVMHIICVTGASGFIGTHVLPLLQQPGTLVRVLSRTGQQSLSGVEVFIGDLFDTKSLARFMRGANSLINLAQPSGTLADELFEDGMRNLAKVARESGLRRVLHISTAMVIGAPAVRRVTEVTPTAPRTTYERQKLNAERVLQSELGCSVDFGVLRPTAVFGAGGLNLLKLMGVIEQGSMFKRRLLRFLHGNRRMHLVSVQDVVEAIIFLIFLPQPLVGNVFLISADDERINNYQSVDAILGSVWGRPMSHSTIRMPGVFLKFLLRLAGRSQADPMLIYDASKIRSWGFQSRSDFTLALTEFAKFCMGKGNQ